MSLGRGARWTVLALAALAGCDGLCERPGHDFAVRVVDQQPITTSDQIYAPVRFTVTGCTEFDLALRFLLDERALGFLPRSDGTFETWVPVALLRMAGACPHVGPDDPAGWEASLVVTCADAGRSATAPFKLVTRTAAAASSWGADVRAVFPGDDPLHPAFILSAPTGGTFQFPPWLYTLDPRWSPWPDFAEARSNSLVRPRLARSGAHTSVSLGCAPNGKCQEPSSPAGAAGPVPTELVAEFALPNRLYAAPIGLAYVPRPVIDMAYAPDGALVVLSQQGSPWDADARTLVTRVAPAPTGSQAPAENAVAIVADLPREAVQTRLARMADGTLAFVTFRIPSPPGDVTAILYLTDGTTLTTAYTADDAGIFDEPYHMVLGRADLSPDGARMLLITLTTTWSASILSTDHLADASREPLPADVDYSEVTGVAWLPDAVALWNGGDAWDPTHSAARPSVVRAFDAAPPHALRWEYPVDALPGAAAAPVLVGVTPVGERLVLTTTTGVRVLDHDGRLVGGSDPLPCGATTTTAAEQVGPTTVGVGAGTTLYVFDVGGDAR